MTYNTTTRVTRYDQHIETFWFSTKLQEVSKKIRGVKRNKWKIVLVYHRFKAHFHKNMEFSAYFELMLPGHQRNEKYVKGEASEQAVRSENPPTPSSYIPSPWQRKIALSPQNVTLLRLVNQDNITWLEQQHCALFPKMAYPRRRSQEIIEMGKTGKEDSAFLRRGFVKIHALDTRSL